MIAHTWKHTIPCFNCDDLWRHCLNKVNYCIVPNKRACLNKRHPPDFWLSPAISQEPLERSLINFSGHIPEVFRSSSCEFHWNWTMSSVWFLPPYPARLSGTIRYVFLGNSLKKWFAMEITLIYTITGVPLNVLSINSLIMIVCLLLEEIWSIIYVQNFTVTISQLP